MNAHILSLAALHAAGSGVLDVVFGPDGDFKDAPPWAGPLTSLADPSRRGWLVWRGFLHVSVATHDGHWSSEVEPWREKWALDLRIPTVATRLAGLCARAANTGLPFRVWDEAQDLYSRTMRGDWGSCGGPQQLAALTLTLAPKIAALKVSP